MVYHTPARYTAGFAIGIIAVNLVYPKMPGNVANATTYPFPVLYQKVDFAIEDLFEGKAFIEEQIVAAAKELEQEGVRAIVGACGYFAHFQEVVAEAVEIPVFMSSLLQLPMIKQSLSPRKKIAVLAASGDNLDEQLLQKVGTDSSRIEVMNVGDLKSFQPIRQGYLDLDHEQLEEELCSVVKEFLKNRVDIGAILLECSDLPPYAKAIQNVSGLPVFDFNSMIDLVYHGVVQKSYQGYF